MIDVNGSFAQNVASNADDQVICVTGNTVNQDIEIFAEDFSQTIEVSNGCSCPPISSDYLFYEGAYEVTPKLMVQTLPTEKTILSKNITIEKIPITKVSNTSGGNTIIIGG